MSNRSLVRRHWYLTTVIAAAALLGVGQAVWRVYAGPSAAGSVVAPILCTSLLFVLALGLGTVAHWLRKFRNRWVTRHIKREMDRVRATGRWARQSSRSVEPADFEFTAEARRPGRRWPW